MARTELVITIHATVERMFELARSIELHLISPRPHWRAHHFGMWQTLTSRITEFDRHRHFRDVMMGGFFTASCAMRSISWRRLARSAGVPNSPFSCGISKKFLTTRNQMIRRVAESGVWRAYLTEGGD